MSDDRPPPYITNERYKSVSRTLFQFGAALVGAAVVRSYTTQVITPETGIWLFIGSILIWAGWLTLSLLEPEK